MGIAGQTISKYVASLLLQDFGKGISFFAIIFSSVYTKRDSEFISAVIPTVLFAVAFSPRPLPEGACTRDQCLYGYIQ